ncbi:MAG: 1-acyl-sn-glycerol-3-phosphate acyltransferase [Deltaproteobacteria bacterium]|nr:1-acyl-sn-glycerol-3-phosphate acyltransferase [Deltaproteobacteria bacterium]MBN2671671.1 1-acyl-sn-glycerol-3-phosphate acyltransferase [Deltaproteobacteria bacterium]
MKKKLIYFHRWLFWTFSRLFCVVYLRPKFKLEVRNTEQKIPKRPFIMVSNHGTFFDPWLIGHLSPYPLSIMMNEEGFKAPKFVQWYLRNIGAFPKKKGESDIAAMKYTLKTLKEGYPVLIFPEGQTTWDGQTQPVFSGIESIIKRSKLPLVMMRITGNFISKPWWSESFRQGKVIVHRNILSVDQLADMSKADIRDAVIQFIGNNDLNNTEMLNTRFSGAPATVGINRFMWMCPSCSTEDHIKGEGDTVQCTKCSASWSLDAHFRLTPRSDNASEIGNLYDWSMWHKQQVKNKISDADATDILTANTGVHYCDVTDLGEYPTISKGTLTLTKKDLSFAPEDNAVEPFVLSVEKVNDYVFQMKTIFECRAEGKVYKFRFEDDSAMKWVYYFRYLNNYADCEERGYI